MPRGMPTPRPTARDLLAHGARVALGVAGPVAVVLVVAVTVHVESCEPRGTTFAASTVGKPLPSLQQSSLPQHHPPVAQGYKMMPPDVPSSYCISRRQTHPTDTTTTHAPGGGTYLTGSIGHTLLRIPRLVRARTAEQHLKRVGKTEPVGEAEVWRRTTRAVGSRGVTGSV